MYKYLKKYIIVVISILLTLVLASKVYAYFTTYTNAGGEIELDIGYIGSYIEIDKPDENLHISPMNVGSADCYIRVKVFAPSDIIKVEYLNSNNKWTYKDGWYYYSDVLEPNQKAEEMEAILKGMVEEDSLNFNYNINVIAVTETTEVLYNQDGTTYANWDFILDTEISEY